jgi:hypothetical protein
MAKRRKRKAKPKQVPAATGMSRRDALQCIASILGILAYFGLTPASLFPPSAPSVGPPVALPPSPAVEGMPPGRGLLTNELVIRQRYTDHQVDQSMIALRSRIVQPSNFLTSA